MPSITLTDEYDRMIEVLKLNSFSNDKKDTELLTSLRSIMGASGPEVTHKKAVENLRSRCERGGVAKFFGAKKSKESDAILGLAGDGAKMNSKAAAIKTLRHLKLLTKFGGQDVWMLSLPKSLGAWALDDYDGDDKATLEANDEHDSVLTVAGYTMGAMWLPTWMEAPLIHTGNPTVLEENMTFFTHMIMNDRVTGLSMAVGETAIITNGAPEIITHVPREPIIRG